MGEERERERERERSVHNFLSYSDPRTDEAMKEESNSAHSVTVGKQPSPCKALCVKAGYVPLGFHTVSLGQCIWPVQKIMLLHSWVT